MLADELISDYSKLHGDYSVYRIHGAEGIDLFVNRMRAAHKFILTDDTYAMVASILKEKPSKLVSSIEYAKAPYPLTWVERISTGTGFSDARPATRKVGYLIEALPNDRYLISMAYSFRDGGKQTNLNPMSFIYDASITSEEFAAIVDYARSLVTEDEINELQQYRKEIGVAKSIQEASDALAAGLSDKEKIIGENLGARFLSVPCPYLIGTTKFMESKLDKKKFMMLQSDWVADWCGEVMIAMGVFILLNCKNAVNLEPSDLDKLNAARMKKGRVPLCDYHVVDINLKAAEDALPHGMDGPEKRMHWRRGHFKRRKTGLYWWSPHLAGRKELGFVEKHYAV